MQETDFSEQLRQGAEKLASYRPSADGLVRNLVTLFVISS